MFYFATCYVDGFDAIQIHKFRTIEDLFNWLEKCLADNGKWPNKLSVFKAECILDGSFQND